MTAWWSPGDVGCRPRTEPVRAVVLHHTGGEGDAEQVCRTLRARRLSIHYVIEADGTIVQCADPATTVCYHAAAANAWSIGVEIVSRGLAPALRPRARTDYADTVHGHRLRFLRFLAPQAVAARELCEALCGRFGLPLAVPRDAGGHVRLERLCDDELAAYRGVLGHLHVSGRKVDPSPHLLRDLWPAPAAQ